MTPKEKAKDLVNVFNEHIEFDTNFYYETNKAKKRALIAVYEILNTNPMIEWGESDSGTEYKSYDYYWEEVKKEIEKL
jgi:hypothetical protein